MTSDMLPVEDVVKHLTTPDGNGWIGRDQYITANKSRRDEIRAAVGELIKSLLVVGLNGSLSDGAITAEHIGNTMWHLIGETEQEDELAASELEDGGPPEPSDQQRAADLAAVEEEDGDV